jgi:hypothetical protein
VTGRGLEGARLLAKEDEAEGGVGHKALAKGLYVNVTHKTDYDNKGMFHTAT